MECISPSNSCEVGPVPVFDAGSDRPVHKLFPRTCVWVVGWLPKFASSVWCRCRKSYMDSAERVGCRTRL